MLGGEGPARTLGAEHKVLKKEGPKAVMNVFLDDWRPAPKHFVPVRSVKDCIELLKTRDIFILSLDHDMGIGQPTGYDLARWMVENNVFPKRIYLHSANPVGRMRMYRLLKRYKPEEVALQNSLVYFGSHFSP